MTTLFLGLDSSTQALKASLLSSDLSVLSEVEVRFDNDLPQYNTRGGTLQGPPGSGIVYSPVMLLVEAMDLLFDRIKTAEWPVQHVRGISAAGQQHASVYWSYQANDLLSQISPDSTLASQLSAAFSRGQVPNWQDSSTLEECALLEEKLGGPSKLASLTGSRAHTRFTGPQIMRFIKSDPEAYQQTSRISLVSSLMTTLLCLDGDIKGIDESDACGMNLWNMQKKDRGWDQSVLDLIAGEKGSKSLEDKLGRVESDGGRVVGHIGQWYVQRYGFSPECVVCPGTGDNPATFLSFSMQESEGLISLGTSDTVLVSTSNYNPDPEYHAFFHPAQIVRPTVQEGSSTTNKESEMRYFNMLVYKNGSLAREHIRDQYFDSSWDQFNRAVESSRPKNAKDLPTQTGFWWLKPEIIPANAAGVFKYHCPQDSSANAAKKIHDFTNPSINAVAILESQMLSYRSRASAILGGKGGSARLIRVFAAGGAASNPVICSVMADVMGCHVCKIVTYDAEKKKWRNADWNICSVAAAYKAAWSWARHTATSEEEKWISFDSFVKRCSDRRSHSRQQIGEDSAQGDSLELLEEGIAVVARPDLQRAKAYSDIVDWWKNLEAIALVESKSVDT